MFIRRLMRFFPWNSYLKALCPLTLMDWQGSIRLYSMKKTADAYYIGEIRTRYQLRGIQKAPNLLKYPDMPTTLTNLV